MATATGTRPVLSPEDRDKLDTLLKEVDSVELKLTVPEPAHFATARALGIDPLDAQLRQVFFLETRDLSLDQHGVVVRARRSQQKGDDSVVKLRPVVPSELSKSTRRAADFGVEVDVSPGGLVCSGSYKGVPKNGNVRKAVLGELPIRKLFSKEQRAFFAEHAPEGVELDDLQILGPLLVLKLKYSPVDFDQRIVCELWLYPDGSRILELSTKCPPAEAWEVGAATRDYLASRGVQLDAPQETKTRSALDYFAKQLAESEKTGEG
jgi:hypothetical protein